MKKQTILLSLIFLFLFSACSGTSTGVKEEVIVGDGLEIIDFDVDEDDISFKEVLFNLRFKNSGKHEVILTKENTHIITLLQTSSGDNVFTEESLNKFYDSLFKNEEIILYNSQETELFDNILEISDEAFCNDSSNNEIKFVFTTSYDYQTDFSNNLNLNLKEKEVYVDRITQAAPVKVEDIELKKTRNGYEIRYYIKDNPNLMSSTNSIVTINKYSINIGTETLSCTPFVELDNGNKKELSNNNLKLTGNQPSIYFVCPFNFEKYIARESTTTKTWGTFEYNYEITKTHKISLPSERDEICQSTNN